MDRPCDINPNVSFTLNELQDEHAGGLIQAIGTLPTLKSDGSLDPTWIRETIETLTKNKLIPVLIIPVLKLPQAPSYPVPPSNSNSACGTYGRSSPPLRLYTKQECDLLDGNFYGNGECTKKTGGSWSWDCRNLNDGDAEAANKVYQEKMNSYRNTLDTIKSLKQRYNNEVVTYNQKNDIYQESVKTERCFYKSRLAYAEKTFFTSASINDVSPNNKMVNYKNEIYNKLKLKLLILKNIASLSFKNSIPLIEAFQGNMGKSTSDINTQHNILTNELTASKLNKRRVDYTLEKNKANQNLLTLFGVLNIVAIGIIYGIASS